MSFFTSYVQAALWSSHDFADDSGGEPLDKNYNPSDIAPDTLARMKDDCIAFQRENSFTLAELDEGQAGHDFWLTRNGHGAGFWDGDYPEEAGKRLTEASKRFGSFDLYVGDDGRIHGQ